jgi:hypothetical protein
VTYAVISFPIWGIGLAALATCFRRDQNSSLKDGIALARARRDKNASLKADGDQFHLFPSAQRSGLVGSMLGIDPLLKEKDGVAAASGKGIIL